MSRKHKGKPTKPRPPRGAAKPSAPRIIEAAAVEDGTAAPPGGALRSMRAEVARMKSLGAEVTTDKLEITGAMKLDVVTMMGRSKTITAAEESAVRKLEVMIDKARTSGGSSLAVLDRVSGGDIGDRGIGAHVQAAIDLTDIQREMDPLTWSLLRELCDGNLLVTRWRAVVQRQTGETGDKAQGAIVRQAFRVLVVAQLAAKRRRDDRPANDQGSADRAA